MSFRKMTEMINFACSLRICGVGKGVAMAGGTKIVFVNCKDVKSYSAYIFKLDTKHGKTEVKKIRCVFI